MSVRYKVGVSNKAFTPEEGHSISKDSGVADVDPEDVIPQLPPKSKPSSPKDAPHNSSRKYDNQHPLPSGAGSGSKSRPTDLAIPNHINSLHAKQRPVSGAPHDYEELPFPKQHKSDPRLLKKSLSDGRYTPSPPPLSNMPANSLYNFSQAGSDVTMISDGPRKRQNPLYDSAKNVRTSHEKSDKSDSKCGGKASHCWWIVLLVLGLAILIVLILLILTIVGAVGSKSASAEALSGCCTSLKNETSLQFAALQQRIEDLEQKIIELEAGYRFLGNLSINSSLSKEFDQMKSNIGNNKNNIDELQETVDSHTTKLKSHSGKIQSLEADIGTLSLSHYNLELAVNDLTKKLPLINDSVNAANQGVRNLMARIQSLEESALIGCELNTTIVDSIAAVHDQLSTPYVLESSGYVIVGLECSATGFSTTARDFDNIDSGRWEKKYRCLCTGPDAQAIRVSCGIHAVMCKTDSNIGR